MEYTPRVSPSDFRAQTSETGGAEGIPAGVYGDPIVGNVEINLANAADLALVNAGTPKDISFYNALTAPWGPTTEPAITLPRLSAFALVFQAVIGDVTYLYDDCAEIQLCCADEQGYRTEEPMARAWLWSSDPASALSSVCPPLHTGQVVMGYEGPPIRPVFTLRPGLLANKSAAAADFWYVFTLVPLARANFAEARITLPSPCCVPPFMPTGTLKGTHLFSQHLTAALTLPGPQPLHIRRQFRSKALGGTFTPASPPPFDAKIFGGPWRAQASGVTYNSQHMLTIDEYQMLQNVPEPYNELLLDSQTGGAVACNKGYLSEAARFVAQGDHPASVELLAVFP